MHSSEEMKWKDPHTMGGKPGKMTEGSVADRGGNYDKPGYSSTKMKKPKRKNFGAKY